MASLVIRHKFQDLSVLSVVHLIFKSHTKFGILVLPRF